MWYKLFIYLFITRLIFLFIALLLSHWHLKELLGFERDSQKTNYSLLNPLRMLTHSVFSKNAIRKVIPFLNFKIVEI